MSVGDLSAGIAATGASSPHTRKATATNTHKYELSSSSSSTSIAAAAESRNEIAKFARVDAVQECARAPTTTQHVHYLSSLEKKCPASALKFNARAYESTFCFCVSATSSRGRCRRGRRRRRCRHRRRCLAVLIGFWRATSSCRRITL